MTVGFLDYFKDSRVFVLLVAVGEDSADETVIVYLFSGSVIVSGTEIGDLKILASETR